MGAETVQRPRPDNIEGLGRVRPKVARVDNGQPGSSERGVARPSLQTLRRSFTTRSASLRQDHLEGDSDQREGSRGSYGASRQVMKLIQCRESIRAPVSTETPNAVI